MFTALIISAVKLRILLRCKTITAYKLQRIAIRCKSVFSVLICPGLCPRIVLTIPGYLEKWDRYEDVDPNSFLASDKKYETSVLYGCIAYMIMMLLVM